MINHEYLDSEDSRAIKEIEAGYDHQAFIDAENSYNSYFEMSEQTKRQMKYARERGLTNSHVKNSL